MCIAPGKSAALDVDYQKDTASFSALNGSAITVLAERQLKLNGVLNTTQQLPC
ncbi:hypothetical protein MJ575_14915 [Klebsiella pneumoniae]|nr:hypothetical protein MJ575_14915 [Klebsiella pneumoniae]